MGSASTPSGLVVLFFLHSALSSRCGSPKESMMNQVQQLCTGSVSEVPSSRFLQCTFFLNIFEYCVEWKSALSSKVHMCYQEPCSIKVSHLRLWSACCNCMQFVSGGTPR